MLANLFAIPIDYFLQMTIWYRQDAPMTISARADLAENQFMLDLKNFLNFLSPGHTAKARQDSLQAAQNTIKELS